jgi:hypothetical protein
MLTSYDPTFQRPPELVPGFALGQIQLKMPKQVQQDEAV